MRIGDYLVMDKLGRGGMGQVYSAIRFREPNFAMPCAIKLLHRELASERARFFEEAQIAAQLDHGRIVKVIDVGEFRERPYLVMEWVDGVNLRTFVDKVREQGTRLPLDLDLVTYIVSEVLAALEYAHERTIAGLDAGIIHYDVTPGNILISSSGEIKLTDFGIARFAATAGPLSRSVGTPRYMAAEQMTGHPCRGTDLYSLGVVLHELIDDKRYLEGHSPDQFRARVLNGPPPGIERQGVPAWLDQLRRQMLQPFADNRPAAKTARSVILKHAGRYHEAVESLKAIYLRCVGPRRSGYTRLYQNGGGGDASLRSMLARQVGRTGREPSDEQWDLDESLERAFGPSEDEIPEDAVTSQRQPIVIKGPPLLERVEPDTPSILRRGAGTLVGVPIQTQTQSAGGDRLLQRDDPANEPTSLDDDDNVYEEPIEPTVRLPPLDELGAANSTAPLALWFPVAAPANVEPAPTLEHPPIEAVARVDSNLVVGPVPVVAATKTRWLPWFVASASLVIAALLVVVIVLAKDRGEAPPNDDGTLQVAAAPSPETEPKPAPTPAREPEPATEVPLRVEPALVVEPPISSPDPTPLLPEEVAPQPASEPEPAATTKPSKREKPPAPKITVALKINGAGGKGQVRINQRKPLTVDLFAFTELTPGTYKLAWRLRETDEWTSAGSLVVGDIGHDLYEVELFAGRNTPKLKKRGNG